MTIFGWVKNLRTPIPFSLSFWYSPTYTFPKLKNIVMIDCVDEDADNDDNDDDDDDDKDDDNDDDDGCCKQ